MFPTLLHVGYYAATDHIQFDMTECVTMQSQITSECVTDQLHITFEHVTDQLHITSECVTD